MSRVASGGFGSGYSGLFTVLLTIAVCFLVVIFLYVLRRKTLKRERERTKELERFISYVCKANDSVLELEIEKMLCQTYQVENGKVTCYDQILSESDIQIENFHPEDIENVRELLNRKNIKHLIETGGELYFESRIIRKEQENQYQWFAFTFQGVPKEGQNPGKLMVFIKNIDQVKREEKEKRLALEDALVVAKQAGEAKELFMSRMSHEIRTPLNVIIGYMTIAKSNIYNPVKQKECLEKSEFAAHHLLSIINDVLDISAIESGKMKIAHEHFNIKQLLAGITSIFHTQAREKEVEFCVKLDNLTEENLIGDQMRLNQILMNLLSNAVKFTPSGGHVTLSISQKTLHEEKVYLKIEVADTGIGISEKYKARIFQPFEQQDVSTAQRFGGTGLGLSITKNLIAMMEGTINVTSEEGKGTVFTVNLSFEAVKGTDRSLEEIYDFSSLRVLVLYDESSDYMYIQTLLERFGVIYDIILNKEEAIREIKEKKKQGQTYDLCLIDWDVPSLADPDTVKQILDAGIDEKPVIAAIAYEIPILPTDIARLQNVILKPVFQSSVFDLLSNLCRINQNGTKNHPEDSDWNLKGIRILLAEDNVMNMEIAKEILGSYGMIIDGVENGKEAAELFEQSEEGTYQAILMDIQMPIMNGYMASKKIRSSKHPQAETIPIIALTADAFTEDINRALAAEMNDHISKPIDFKQLYKTLLKYIDISEPH